MSRQWLQIRLKIKNKIKSKTTVLIQAFVRRVRTNGLSEISKFVAMCKGMVRPQTGTWNGRFSDDTGVFLEERMTHTVALR